ncbi:MAG: RIP metalloprotease RseP [Planctomycetes bacterium]|nr:RIP metalloprotease RseP [Planctomycetota bacterium]
MLSFLSGALHVLEVVFGVGLVIFAHELGHFLMAKWRGVRVDVFSLGFGKRLFGFERGGTDYRVSVVPLGGYVKMAGETVADETTGSPDELTSKPAWVRFLVFCAGPGMNFVIAIPLCMLTFILGIWRHAPEIGHIHDECPEWTADVQRGDVVRSVNGDEVRSLDEYRIAMMRSDRGLPVDVGLVRDGRELHVPVISRGAEAASPLGVWESMVASLGEGSAAMEAGLHVGDKITAVDGRPVHTFHELRYAIVASPNKPLALTVEREGEPAPLRITLVPKADKEHHEYRLDLDDAEPAVISSAKFGSPCWRGGPAPQAGDKLVRVKVPEPIETLSRLDLRNALTGRIGQQLTLVVLRGEKETEIPAVPVPDYEGRASLDVSYRSGNVLGKVAPDSPLAKAGLAVGDKLVKVSARLAGSEGCFLRKLFGGGAQAQEEAITALAQLDGVVQNTRAADLTVEYVRDGKLQSATLRPREVEVGFAGLGGRSRQVYVQYPVGASAAAGLRETWRLFALTYETLKKLVTGEVSAKGLSGPVGIFAISYDAAEKGFSNLLWFLAFISVNLALVNLLPIPILDGGHIFFLVIEKIKGKPVSGRALEVAQYAGLALLLGLVFFTFYNDVFRLWRG